MITPTTIKTGHHVCGFCSTGHHDRCPSAVLNGDEVTVIACPCPCDSPARCMNCYTREDVNPETFVCDDRDACAMRTEQSRREAQEKLFGGRARPDAPEGRTSSRKTPRSARPTTSGQCLCCGEATKGGLFLPGHDSKYLNARIADVSGVTAPEDVVDRMRTDGCSDALIAKFQKRIAA